MDYQNKKKFKKLQKKKEHRRLKMKARREAAMKERQVQAMLDKMNYESRTRYKPIRKRRVEANNEEES
jgi:hypothetical protein